MASDTALGRALRSIPAGPLRRVRRFEADPAAAQRRLLAGLLRRAADTEWGRRFRFRELLAAPDVVRAYQQAVPLAEFEAFRADFDRVRLGASDVVWPGRLNRFAVSSGTASAGKVLPLSHEMLTANRGFSIGVALNYLAASGNPSFLGGRHLTLPGRIEPDPLMPGSRVGEVSGLQAEYAPGFFKRLYQAVPNDMAFLPNWEQKLEAIVAHTLRQDIRMIAMVPSWALTFSRMVIERCRQETGRNVQTVGEVWPRLQVFISGGVALSSYKSLLDDLIGLPRMDYVETYGASEGFFAFQSDPDDPALLLHLDNGVFFEFVRMDEHQQPGARRYTIADVEPDVRYTLYVTTCSGLWSYNVRDVVRFTSTRPHKIVVAGRSSEMIDNYGEAVFGEEAAEALREACEVTGARVASFHVAPRPPASAAELPTHQWIIEFERAPESLEAFARAIDARLQRVNRHYQIRREARAFGLVEVTAAPPGTFYAWLKRTRRSVSGQTKIPRMSEDRTIADALLSADGAKQ